jgi:uncharacterized protein YprB with RNaseH-like and TPR domain/predicted nuclease with RNAse H fold/dephospho-CoA kinase
MLKSTFRHIKGIGKKTEQSLWAKGLATWDEYERFLSIQYTLFDDSSHELDSILYKSRIAYEKEDMAFFSNTLSTAEYYRIALEYPNEVLFLDIETTGLSLYYDIISMIGWSVGEEFGIYINGQDPSFLKRALKNAKVIVTFNGTMFDLKFIEKHFKSLSIPSVHIDLRFFAKRVGLSGGQKAIEKQIGFKRKSDIEDMQGEAAPILWHKYRKGDLAAMNRLIEYNHADVEGMKVILDYCIEKYFEKDKIPKNIRRKPNFSLQKSRIRWTKKGLNNNKPYNIFVPPFTGSNKPLITYRQLSHILPLDELCIIGIDLVSSEDRETGLCILKGNKATTCRLKTDDELIKFSFENGADIVSIDSPLSIPKGRTSFFDDDPFRDEFGITRECERLLKRRGISSYPCLIPSMQKLTRRGMVLAQKFRSLGIPVIESYPGAAQDIMSIPRKQAGLDYLIEGLKEFGITGDFIKSSVTHDELDAITSAIVGLFFWAGMYEALGNPDEEYLIIPDLNADYQSRLSRIVVGLSGEIATGKTASAEFLKSRGFSSTRYSKILEKLLLNEDISPSRTALQKLGWKVNQEKGQRWLGKKILDEVENKKHFVVDGLRFLEDHALMVETYGPSFKHIHLKASLDNRKKRVPESMQHSLNAEVLEHKVEKEINQLESVSHLVITNDGTLKEFFQSLKEALGAEKRICQ